MHGVFQEKTQLTKTSAQRVSEEGAQIAYCPPKRRRQPTCSQQPENVSHRSDIQAFGIHTILYPYPEQVPGTRGTYTRQGGSEKRWEWDGPGTHLSRYHLKSCTRRAWDNKKPNLEESGSLMLTELLAGPLSAKEGEDGSSTRIS